MEENNPGPMHLVIRPADLKADHDRIYDIRNIVYIIGQDCPFDEEFDGFDEGAEHFLAYLDGAVAGYCRLRMLDGKAKLERFAVYEEYRGKGFGKQLVKFLLDLCLDRGYSDIYLNAQVRAQGFYEALGFTACGEHFMEAGIVHVKMEYLRQ